MRPQPTPRFLASALFVLVIVLFGVSPTVGGIALAVFLIGGLAVGLPLLANGYSNSMRRLPRSSHSRPDNASALSLEEGGLPTAAKARLAQLASGGAGFFTSDLSVNEFALLSKEGIVPVTQVMGSSIFQHGWRNLPNYRARYGGGWRGGGWTEELTSVSDAFNGARERALDRLLQEAQLARADAVVGVHINSEGHDWAAAGTVEFTAVGTAVRLPDELKTGTVVITDLSGQEYWQLAQDGIRPVGVVGMTTVMYVGSGWSQNRVLSSGNSLFSVAGRSNQEITDFTQGFYEAREVAMFNLQSQANSLGAHGIVGVHVDTHMREREWEDSNDNSHHDLVVYVHLLGTAITEGHPPSARAGKVMTIMPVTANRT
jgi:uncharacterized protein YbjQ (UPF0145 family)